ncbi:MAG TPA: molybdenum cofactor guanylyltransferase [Methanolinea sp.]|nr:molybdenum cofactor guanylyltransferase [Methanolinea sp.]HQK55380.1 molybdenum cofactor guanylyltransferase [Methanolinea sp.]
MDRSGVILVGGEARRANGLEKYFFKYGGRTFIERLTETLAGVVDEIVLVAKDPAQCTRFSHLKDVRCVADIRRGHGPIGGLHAGALAAHGEAIFVCACDMPCVSTEVVTRLFSLLDEFDAVIPQWTTDMIEPLHAVYRRTALLRALENHESLSVRRMVQGMHARYVDVATIREIDPDLRTFTNINKVEDLGRLS